MKTLKPHIFAAVAAAVAASAFVCCSNDDSNVSIAHKLVVSAEIEDETAAGGRLALGDLNQSTNKRPVYWSNGDAINLNGYESEALENIATLNQRAQFRFATVKKLTAPYKALYPKSAYLAEGKMVLPSVQRLASGVPESPMAGYTSAESGDGSVNIQFRHLCGAMSVSLEAAAEYTSRIYYVEVSSKNGMQLNGRFTLDYQTQTITGDGVDENGTVSGDVGFDKDEVEDVIEGSEDLEFSVGLGTRATTAYDITKVYAVANMDISQSAPAEILVILPPGTYADGFDFKVVDNDNHCYAGSVAGEVTVREGHVGAFTITEFHPVDSDMVVIPGLPAPDVTE